jgi:hypothetical protein
MILYSSFVMIFCLFIAYKNAVVTKVITMQ